jgi:hypothetical protein
VAALLVWRKSYHQGNQRKGSSPERTWLITSNTEVSSRYLNVLATAIEKLYLIIKQPFQGKSGI